MELIIFIIVVIVIYLFYTGAKFTNFKSKLMSEFGQHGVDFELADEIYYQQKDRINTMQADGMPTNQIVLRILSEIEENLIKQPNKYSTIQATKIETTNTELKETLKEKYIGIVYAIISMQFNTASYKAFEEKEMHPSDSFVLGYIFGLTSAVMQVDNYYPDNPTNRLEVIHDVFGEIYGKKGPSNFDWAIDMQTDPDFYDANEIGGKEFLKMKQSISDKPYIANQLFKYLSSIR